MSTSCAGWRAAHSLYIGVPFVIASLVLTLLSLVAPYWRAGDGTAEGLFYYCNTTTGHCHFLSHIEHGDDVVWRACQLMYAVLTVCSVQGSVATLLYAWKFQHCDEIRATLPNAVLVLEVIAGVLIIAVTVLYRVCVNTNPSSLDLHFCLYAAQAAGPFYFIGGINVRAAHCGSVVGKGRRTGYPLRGVVKGSWGEAATW